MPDQLLQRYPLIAERYDEMLAAPLQARPHWYGFVQRFAQLDAANLKDRAEFVRDAITNDGMSYSLHDAAWQEALLDPPSPETLPWQLDILPLLLAEAEWQFLAQGVQQRARLLNAMLADLYGPQNLLRDGLLPAALVFGHPDYHWPVRTAFPLGGRYLHDYATDLGRSPDGRWWVIGDHTQTPSGAGYALQNRLVISQTFSDAFRDQHVHTIAPFFRDVQEHFTQTAPSDGHTALVVLLSSGPSSQHYFEHAFLARYLGFPLVEGGDLTVRDDRVFLKTLRGLRRVHGIVRRLDDDHCDPLELRSDSALGVPGLLGAVRAGQVLIANALGSGVVQSAALFGFLPAISEYLLGETLLLPSVASWWCGEPRALEYVIEHLDDLVIKPAFPNMRFQSLFGHQLHGEARDALIQSLRAQPHAYVAQEWVRLSHAPVWTAGPHYPLTPRAVGLRLVAAAHEQGYAVMPGALARIAPHGGQEVISMQRGGLAKDVWVCGDTPPLRINLIKPRLSVADLEHSHSDVPSRVGENLFWMGRHSERCESSTRILRAALLRASSNTGGVDEELENLLAAARTIGALPPQSPVPQTPSHPDQVATPAVPYEQMLLNAITNRFQPGSVTSNLLALSQNASHVRERLSVDNWRLLNRISQALTPPPTTVDQALHMLDQIMQYCVALAGFALDDMTRDEGWRFLLLGRQLERLAGLAQMIGWVIHSPSRHSHDMLEWLLDVANSSVTYRARYRRSPEILPVLHLLVFDASNPHAVLYQVRSILRYLHDSAAALDHPIPPRIEKLHDSLTHFDLSQLDPERQEIGLNALHAVLMEAEETAYAISDDIHQRLFIHTVSPTHVRGLA